MLWALLHMYILSIHKHAMCALSIKVKVWTFSLGLWRVGTTRDNEVFYTFFMTDVQHNCKREN